MRRTLGAGVLAVTAALLIALPAMASETLSVGGSYSCSTFESTNGTSRLHYNVGAHTPVGGEVLDLAVQLQQSDGTFVDQNYHQQLPLAAGETRYPGEFSVSVPSNLVGQTLRVVISPVSPSGLTLTGTPTSAPFFCKPGL